MGYSVLPINPFVYFTDYVEEIYQTFVEAHKANKLADAITELNDITPAPMNTMLNKQPREEAIKKMKQRREMTVEDIPPTTGIRNCVNDLLTM